MWLTLIAFKIDHSCTQSNSVFPRIGLTEQQTQAVKSDKLETNQHFNIHHKSQSKKNIKTPHPDTIPIHVHTQRKKRKEKRT